MATKRERYYKEATEWYALAICVYLSNHGGTATTQDHISEHYSQREDGYVEADYALPNDTIFKNALSFLESRNVVQLKTLPYAPTIIRAGENFHDGWRALEAELPCFTACAELFQPETWMMKALWNLAAENSIENMKPEDFIDQEPVDEWAPLPIDRTEGEAKTAIAAVDDLIQQVEKDNGYAVHHPEERDDVLSSLKGFSEKSKTSDTISPGFVKQWFIRPMVKLTKMFGKAALNGALEWAKESVKAWLTKNGIPWPGDWL